ncbi:MAG: helicase RepA family protein, partial [Tannerella sp.]|nr:helicase RepA family protein [Tannerella sp.]
MNKKEKTTVSNSSVGADVKQSSGNKNLNKSISDMLIEGNQQTINNDGKNQSERNKQAVKIDVVCPEQSGQDNLETISMTELYDHIYPPKIPVIENLLYNGMYFFAGAPKIGKSFFVAQLGYHVSMGLPLWNYPVRQGTVLYLALEDDYGRLQKRLSKMFGMEGSEHFYFATSAKTLNNGLSEQLNEFVTAHKDARLIIIDTFQKVREAGGDKFSYAGDYEIVANLKRFSDTHNIALLVVHHTRKMESADSMEMISGSTGLLGAADGAFTLLKEKRTDNKAVLEVVGRDQQDQKLYLNFNRALCLWELTKTETELWKQPPDPVLAAIAGIVSTEKPEWVGNATELLGFLPGVDMQPNVLTRKLNI